MRYSKEHQKVHLNRIRRVLVMKPDISILEIQDLLQKQKVPLKLNKDYINRLVNKIRKEQAGRLNYYTINKVLAKFQDEIEELKKRLWLIITDEDSSDMNKIMAIRELRNSSKDLFDKMFDAGVFRRKLGELEVEDKSKTLTNLLKNADPKVQKEFIKTWRKLQGLPDRGGNIPEPPTDADRKGDLPTPPESEKK